MSVQMSYKGGNIEYNVKSSEEYVINKPNGLVYANKSSADKIYGKGNGTFVFGVPGNYGHTDKTYTLSTKINDDYCTNVQSSGVTVISKYDSNLLISDFEDNGHVDISGDINYGHSGDTPIGYILNKTTKTINLTVTHNYTGSSSVDINITMPTNIKNDFISLLNGGTLVNITDGGYDVSVDNFTLYLNDTDSGQLYTSSNDANTYVKSITIKLFYDQHLNE